MTFFTSLSGLRAAQTDLNVVSNNLANVGSTGFKKSRAQFGDLFASGPTQSTRQVAGQGTRLNAITQQFSQGTLESTDRTLDLAIAGGGFFVVQGDPPRDQVAYTRNGEFEVAPDRRVVDTTGSTLQLLPVDANGTITAADLASTFDFILPATAAANPAAELVNISINNEGLVNATFSDGTTEMQGKIALASFTSQQGLRPIGDAHWQSTGDSGPPVINAANNGPLGSVRSGTLERANVDVTEELVSLIDAQRNYQANARAIETNSDITETIINIR